MMGDLQDLLKATKEPQVHCHVFNLKRHSKHNTGIMFVIRRVLSHDKWLPNIRGLSNQGSLVDLTVNDDGVAIMSLQRPPVNSINLDLLKEMSSALDDVAKKKSRAMILTSASPKVFSAGVDIMEMYKPDMKRLKEFVWTLQDVWLKLFGSNFITAAAINGHAPAGGCLLAMCCEYRVMTSGKFTIGLNETALGIAASAWFIDTMTNILPLREAENALTSARMFTVEEAFKVGLIDEVATDKAGAVVKCKNFIGKFNRIPPFARSVTKLRMRQSTIKKLQDGRQADADELVEMIVNPKTQNSLKTYLQILKKTA